MVTMSLRNDIVSQAAQQALAACDVHALSGIDADTGKRPPGIPKLCDEQPKIVDEAIRLLDGGYWSIAIYPPGVVIGKREPTNGKEPIGSQWGLVRWDKEKLRETFARYPKAGAGICFGPGRAPGQGWLIDLEGDGPQAEESLSILLGGEDPTTMGWRSARGAHNVFKADGERLLKALSGAGCKESKGQPGVFHLDELPGLEFRIGGYKPDGTVKQVQSVIPPTPGTDGMPREWTNPPSVGAAALPEVAYLCLETIAASKHPVVEPAHAAGNGRAATGGNGQQCDANPPVGPSVETWAIRYLEKIDPAIQGQKGSSPTFRAACVMARFGLPKDTALRLLLDHYNPRCVPPWREAELRHKIDDAYKAESNHGSMATSSPRRPGVSAPSEDRKRRVAVDTRPKIEINTERHLAVEATVKAIASDPEIYRLGDTLGTVVEEEFESVTLPDGGNYGAPEGVRGSWRCPSRPSAAS
jgi:hypothetical protein